MSTIWELSDQECEITMMNRLRLQLKKWATHKDRWVMEAEECKLKKESKGDAGNLKKQQHGNRRKESSDELTSRLIAKERIGELEDISIKTSSTEK